MSERQNGYFSLSAEELEKNPQLRAMVDDGVVSEDGWDAEEQAAAEKEIEALKKRLKEQVDYQLFPYDSSK